MFNEQQLKNILISAKLIAEADFEKLSREARENDKRLEDLLAEKKIISTEDLAKEAAKYYQVPFVNLKEQTIRKEALYNVPEPIAIAHDLIAFDQTDKKLKIAVLDPEDLETFDFIRKKSGLEPEIYLTTSDSIKEGLKQYRETLKTELINFCEPEENKSSSVGSENAPDLEKIATDVPIVRIVNDLLEYAMFKDASDIHIEPEERDVIVRYRIDGILYNVMTLPKSTQAGIIARIKILASLKVDEHRLPQDGRFKIHTEKYNVSYRVSIIPAFDGEKIVIRLLDEKAQVLSLESLGLLANSLEIVKRNILKPHGMILVTGPTGSGKTTTLYTVLSVLNTPRVNIATIEDPIEYRIPHVNQSQINPKIGFTFEAGLRSLLRQDPNIIMVGEIRDEETAKIAVHAAMTGHLLLSTLHTNDAVTTLPRLSQMGIPPFLIASTTNLIIAQRLVRKVCPYCKEAYHLSKKAVEDIEKQLDIPGMLAKLEKEKLISQHNLETMTFYRGVGCKKCNNSGYKGRIGVYETLEMTPEMAELTLNTTDSSILKKQAEKQGMLTLIEDGFIKAINGLTNLEEVMRVTKE
ncbi:MAG TPA: GspE/PulE family protein [Candidatus Methylomirabilis sp.]|nr:GspE/PulE family protein [Candidatus Methylomirabilis sp.]